MALISVSDLDFGFGSEPLFDGAELTIDDGERVCLIGRNGEGKSTLLKLLSGEIPLESGSLAVRSGARIAMLEQQVPTHLEGTIYDVVAAGLGARGDLLRRYHSVSERLALESERSDALLAEIERLQHEIDSAGAWELQREVDRALSKLGLDADADAEVATLSAGMKRRALLARALASDPDLLLLDEPTNHLDVDSIEWLEDFLKRHDSTLLFVTHDRMFLKNVATRILELDRGQLTSWPCDYDTYLERREHALELESKEWQKLDKKLAEEEAWLRKGIRARRTRNEGRVRALGELRETRRARRERIGSMRATIEHGDRSGQLVIDAEHLSFSFGEHCIVSNLTFKVMRGDKIGLIGRNGVGKTTLLKLLLGQLEPDSGTARHGVKLEIAYFDQLHSQLDDSKTLIENISDGQDFIDVGGRRRHLSVYLEEFLFTPDRARCLLSALSGGERNRLLLAKMFARPANVLVLDEPTNDLDVESLELLEQLLIEYEGTLLIVSHDRAFLDNVATSSLVFEGDGRVRELVGGYQAWQRIRADAERAAADAIASRAVQARVGKPKSESRRRLTYSEQRELEQLPKQIEQLEARISELHESMAAPDFYRQDATAITGANADLADCEERLAQAYERWEDLESLA